MNLKLYREDLREQDRGVHPSKVAFEHLNDRAQMAVLVIGEGEFYPDAGQRRTYKVIQSPRAVDPYCCPECGGVNVHIGTWSDINNYRVYLFCNDCELHLDDVETRSSLKSSEA